MSQSVPPSDQTRREPNPYLEKRRHPRFSLRLRVQYRHLDRTLDIESRDISIGGVFLKTASPAEKGTEVWLTIELPEEFGYVVVRGSVVHHLPGGGMGIAFTDFEAGSHDKLNHYLRTMD